ncbi:uncharacterized protein LOC120237133 [Hyaena hyaena]|uniref:uncharacterized protein LOC120237133 n=1 Tax=Hyaena hyaena TaxID=95912 RepID=UPI001921E608|nr:uncharacterized protein LOC120237133 [Hyaena hyaena]
MSSKNPGRNSLSIDHYKGGIRHLKRDFRSLQAQRPQNDNKVDSGTVPDSTTMKVSNLTSNNWAFPVQTTGTFPPSGPLPPMPHSKGVGLKAAVRGAEKEGDTDFVCCFPVALGGEFDEDPSWEPLPYKIIKELKTACTEYGPLAPYTLTLLETLISRWMTPYDRIQVAKACLSGGQYLLWKAEYDDLARKRAAINKRTNRRDITLDKLLGKGDFDTAQDQMYLNKVTLQQTLIVPLTHGELCQLQQAGLLPWEKSDNDRMKAMRILCLDSYKLLEE